MPGRHPSDTEYDEADRSRRSWRESEAAHERQDRERVPIEGERGPALRMDATDAPIPADGNYSLRK